MKGKNESMAEGRAKPFSRALMRWTRPLRYRLTYPVLEVCRLVIGLLPHGMVPWLGRGLGRLAWLFGGQKRRLAERQMQEAGVAQDARSVTILSRGMYQSLAMNGLEWLHSRSWDEWTVRERVTIEGSDLFLEALGEGKGAILVTGHLGNWELMLLALRIHTGQSLAAVMAETRNAQLDHWLKRMREQSGHTIISHKTALIGMVRHLRRGGLLAMLADQDSTRGRGVFVDFFGKPAYTPAGPAHLAHRMGVPIIPMTMLRREDDPRRHHYRIHAPIHADPAADQESEIRRITQLYTKVLEEQIRKAPAQWVWIHERWRHSPGQKVRVRSAGGKLRQA